MVNKMAFETRKSVDLVIEDSIREFSDDLKNLGAEIVQKRDKKVAKMVKVKGKTLIQNSKTQEPFLEYFPCTIEKTIVANGKKYKMCIDIDAKFIVDLNDEAARVLQVEDEPVFFADCNR